MKRETRPKIQSPMGTRPALSAGLPSSTSSTCHTLSDAVSGWHRRILSPSKDGWALEGDFCGSLFRWDHTREGIIGTTFWCNWPLVIIIVYE